MAELIIEITDGEIKKMNEEENYGQLSVQLGVEDFYDKIPENDNRT